MLLYAHLTWSVILLQMNLVKISTKILRSSKKFSDERTKLESGVFPVIAVLSAVPSLRSPWKCVFSIIKTVFIWSKYPENISFTFQNKITGSSDSVFKIESNTLGIFWSCECCPLYYKCMIFGVTPTVYRLKQNHWWGHTPQQCCRFSQNVAGVTLAVNCLFLLVDNTCIRSMYPKRI